MNDFERKTNICDYMSHVFRHSFLLIYILYGILSIAVYFFERIYYHLGRKTDKDSERNICDLENYKKIFFK